MKKFKKHISLLEGLLFSTCAFGSVVSSINHRENFDLNQQILNLTSVKSADRILYKKLDKTKDKSSDKESNPVKRVRFFTESMRLVLKTRKEEEEELAAATLTNKLKKIEKFFWNNFEKKDKNGVSKALKAYFVCRKDFHTRVTDSVLEKIAFLFCHGKVVESRVLEIENKVEIKRLIENQEKQEEKDEIKAEIKRRIGNQVALKVREIAGNLSDGTMLGILGLCSFFNRDTASFAKEIILERKKTGSWNQK